MPTYRKAGNDISVFTLGGNDFLCQLINASIDIDVDFEDARAVCSDWGYAWAKSKSWTCQGELYVGQTVPLLSDLVSGDALVTVAANTGAATLSGNALITNISYSFGAGDLQKVSFTLTGQGEISES